MRHRCRQEASFGNMLPRVDFVTREMDTHMAYDFFEIPTHDGRNIDIVFADPTQPPMPSFVHYGYAVGSAAASWPELTVRRGIPLAELRNWKQFAQRHPLAAERLGSGRGYTPGESVLRAAAVPSEYSSHTAMRLGALELIANIFSGRITANDKDPFPHQLALQQFMRAEDARVQRILVADEVGLGKTIEIGLVLRDVLIARGSLDEFSCMYLTSGGLVEDAAQKLRSVLRGALGEQNIVSEVESFVQFGRGNTRGIHVASMHAARLYTDQKKQNLVAGVAPDIVVIDECHHCASDERLAGASAIARRNATLTYVAAHQLVGGQFWPGSRPPRLVILMSATPFRNTEQFANLLRLLTHGVDGFNAYAHDTDARRLIERVRAPESKSAIAWRRQDDESVRSWLGERLFPNLRIVRPHRDEPRQLGITPEYLAIISEIRTAIRQVMMNHKAHFGGFAIAQLEKKLTSSSIAGACYLFSWCVRHSIWQSLDAYRRDVSIATDSLRRLLIEISQRLATFDKQSTARHAEVYLPSDGFRFEARALSQGGTLPDIYRFQEKLREAADDDHAAFIADSDEIQKITGLGLRLLRFSQDGSNGVENAKLQWLENMLLEHADARFLVFTESLQTCAIIQSAMSRTCRTLTGDMGASKRDEVVAEFRNPRSSVRVLVATSAADEGFDLQVANRVVHWDLSSSPAVLMQRNGRVARLGQISDVTAYYLILPGTHEERRDSALVERFAALGINDARLQLKILGTLTDEEQSRLEEAIELNEMNMVGEMLFSARRDNEEMDRKLQELSASLKVMWVLDRKQLAKRLQAWAGMGLPESEAVELKFQQVRWMRPVFGEHSSAEEAFAQVATITLESNHQEVTFDPEFKVFSPESRNYRLAGLRPWTLKTRFNQQMEIRPDQSIDMLGGLAFSLARLPHADFTILSRAALADVIPALASSSYILFATHPMREGETVDDARMAPYLTFYAFADLNAEPYFEGKADDVHRLITLLEQDARRRGEPLRDDDAKRHLAAGERIRAWLKGRARIGGASLFEAALYRLPIPVALLAIQDSG